jgi:hypothetical protein
MKRTSTNGSYHRHRSRHNIHHSHLFDHWRASSLEKHFACGLLGSAIAVEIGRLVDWLMREKYEYE